MLLRSAARDHQRKLAELEVAERLRVVVRKSALKRINYLHHEMACSCVLNLDSFYR